MKIDCEECAASFEARNGERLCPACRDEEDFTYPERWGAPRLGRVIPTALRLWRDTLGRTMNLGMIAVVGIAFSLIVDCYAAVDPTLEKSVVPTIATLIYVLVGLPLFLLCSTTACFVAAEHLAFSQQRYGLWAIFKHSSRFFWNYLGSSWLAGLPVGAFLVPGAILWALELRPIAIAAFAVCGLFAVRLLVRWSFLGEAIFFEGRAGTSSLDRSRDLVIGATWPVLGLVSLQALITCALYCVWPELAPIIGPLPAAILSIIGNAFSLGLGAVWSFTIYAALRDRESGAVASTPP